MSNMSYCALENTSEDLEQVIELLEECNVSNSSYERGAFENLKKLCSLFIEITENSEFEHFTKNDD